MDRVLLVSPFDQLTNFKRVSVVQGNMLGVEILNVVEFVGVTLTTTILPVASVVYVRPSTVMVMLFAVGVKATVRLMMPYVGSMLESPKPIR